MGFAAALVCCVATVAFGAATYRECNYPSGHGMVVLAAPDCRSFVAHHLGEFECPHHWDVKLRFRFASESDRVTFCGLNASLFTLAPTVVLPSLAQASPPAPFTSDVMTGFFGNPALSNVRFWLDRTLYVAEYGLLRPRTLQYLVLPEQGSNTFIAWHLVTTPPDFDQVLRVSLTGVSFPKGRDWPLLLELDLPNEYEHRLSLGQRYPIRSPAGSLRVDKLLYPTADKENGDGTTDFLQYCVNKTRPQWALC